MYNFLFTQNDNNYYLLSCVPQWPHQTTALCALRVSKERDIHCASQRAFSRLHVESNSLNSPQYITVDIH